MSGFFYNRLIRAWQSQGKGGAFAWAADAFQRTVVQAGQVFGHGQAEARSLVFSGVFGPVERLKYEILFFYINAGSEVFYAHDNILAMALDFDKYLILGLRILTGIRNQARYYAVQEFFIGHNPARLFRLDKLNSGTIREDP